jgi:hypothetical protein
MVGAAKTQQNSPPVTSDPSALLQAMQACWERADAEGTPAERIVLISAALLFAQVVEHLERGIPLTPPIITHCRDAASLIRDDQTRRRIEGLLSEIIG